MTSATGFRRGPFQGSFLEAKFWFKPIQCSCTCKLTVIPLAGDFKALLQQMLWPGSSQPWLLLWLSHFLWSRLLDLLFQAPIATSLLIFGFMPASQTHPFPWVYCQILCVHSHLSWRTLDCLNLLHALQHILWALTVLSKYAFYWKSTHAFFTFLVSL